MKKYHPEILKSIEDKDYEKICQHLHTKQYESDSEWTKKRCQDSFVQGWKDCEKYYEAKIKADKE